MLYQKTLTYRVGHAETLNAISKNILLIITYRVGHAEKLNAISININL